MVEISHKRNEFIISPTKYLVDKGKPNVHGDIGTTSFPGFSLFLPRERTLAAAGHVHLAN